MNEAKPSNLCVYTIGHSNHDIDTFLGLLTRHEIEVLVDTRSSPFSHYAPQFNRDPLKESAEGAGLRYGFWGRPLGGRPDDESLYDADGHVLYGEVAKTFLFQDGLARLMAGIEKRRTALLCSEENPNICHRRLLISRVLFEAGIDVRHIRGDGTVQSEADLRLAESKRRQPALFDEEPADNTWKSIQSVLRKVPPPAFSDD